MRKSSWIKGLGAAALTVVMLAGGNAMAAEKITITGSTTVLPIAQKAAEVYMNMNKDVAISVAGTGSGDGLKALIDGTADIGDSSRKAKDKELKLAEAKGVELKKHVVGLDCIVPVVHPSNPVTGLTMEQLKDIYTGKTTNWKEVGGEDKPIMVFSRDSSSGTFEVWHKLVLKKERVRQDAGTQASNGAVATAVAGNKYAIGYVGIGYLNPKLKGLTVNGLTASAATARDGSYPIARELYMYTSGDPKGAVKDFLEFVMGPKGQKIAEEEGFVAAR